MQASCVRWFRLTYPRHARLLFAIPNGWLRSWRTAKILKAEGVTPGVPDMMLAIPSGTAHALFIEFKSGRNTTSQEQSEMIALLTTQGYLVAVVYSIDEFISLITNYLPK